MKTADQEWWIEQAGEYVLGTLRGPERDLFEKIQEKDRDIGALVDFWDNYFYRLNRSTPAIQPPESVWNQIELALEFKHAINQQQPDGESPPSAYKQRQEPTVRDLTEAEQRQIRPHVFTRALSAMALAASLIFGVVLVDRLHTGSPDSLSDYNGMTVIADATGQGLWAVTSNLAGTTLKVVALSPPVLEEDQVHELWLVRKEEAGVVSMGLLPQSEGVVRAFESDIPLAEGVAFAVSIEPSGGSPENVPTGPVVYSGPITALESAI